MFGALQIEKADAFALRDQRHAQRRRIRHAIQMIAGYVDRRASGTMRLAPAQRPAGRWRKVGARQRGFAPGADLLHQPRPAVLHIEATSKERRDLRREAAHDLGQVAHRVAPLKPLGHAGQQVARSPVALALLFQLLPLQPVLAEDADRLSHVTNLVHLPQVGRDGGIILGGQPRHHIAEAHHRMKNALLQDEIEDAQEQQRSDAQHHFRHGAPQPGRFGRARHRLIRALVQHILELGDLRRDAIHFTAIFVAEQDGAGRRVLILLRRLERSVLLVEQRVGPIERLLQRLQLGQAGARILEVTDAILDRAQRRAFAAIGDHMAGIARDHETARLFAQAIDILLQRGGQLIEDGALGNGRTLLFLDMGREQHGRARSERQRDGRAISPVGDRGKPHGRATLGPRDWRLINHGTGVEATAILFRRARGTFVHSFRREGAGVESASAPRVARCLMPPSFRFASFPPSPCWKARSIPRRLPSRRAH